MRRINTVSFFLLLTFSELSHASAPPTITDNHVHFVDFLQQSEGMPALLAAINQAHVDNVVIFGMPVIKKWTAKDMIQPKYYLDNDAKAYFYSLTDEMVAKAILAQPKAVQKNFIPLSVALTQPTKTRSLISKP